MQWAQPVSLKTRSIAVPDIAFHAKRSGL